MSKRPYDEVLEDDLEGSDPPDTLSRLNRKTVAVVGGTLLALFAIAFIWGTQPAKQGPQTARSRDVQPAARPLALEELPASYGDVTADADFNPFPDPPIVPDESLLATPERGPVVVATAAAPPAASSGGGVPPVDLARLDALTAQLEAAVAARTEADTQANAAPILFAGGRVSGAGAPGVAQSANATPFELGGDGFASPVLAETPVPEGVRSNLQTEKKAFTAGGSGAVEGVLDQKLVPPASPYLLQAGHSIGAALITAINTDLPGRIVAHTTEPVYDSVTGRHLLIPAGARLLGSYDSLVSNGQDRALLVWERMILPNGDSMILDAMLGVDATGAAGKKDRVDFHLDRLLGGVLLSTAISYGANSVQDANDDDDDIDLLGESIAQQSSSIGTRVVDRILDIQPTITIRQGARVRVLVEQDMVLQPYTY